MGRREGRKEGRGEERKRRRDVEGRTVNSERKEEGKEEIGKKEEG